ncbi:MAG: sulfotransferase [Phycisphaerae bacterium]
MTNLAFIMSASHSGSTLLAFLIGSHPQATTIGDTAGTPLRNRPGYRCSCGALARDCPFWLDVKHAMEARGFTFDITDFGTRFEMPERPVVARTLRAEHRGPVLEAVRDCVLSASPAWRTHFADIARRTTALVETVLEQTGARVLVDSSKQPHRLKFLLRVPGLRVKVIHLVRDGRGVVHTYLHDNNWSVKRSAEEWRRGVRSARRLLARLDPNQWIQVRYEDYCADPIGAIKRIATFLDLDPNAVNLDFRAADLHVFGNKMRMADEPRILLDEHWKTDLTDDDIRTVRSIAGRELQRYGYA